MKTEPQIGGDLERSLMLPRPAPQKTRPDPEKKESLGVFDWDFRTGRVTWSRSLEVIFGFPRGRSNYVWEDWAGRVVPADLAGMEKAMDEWIASGSAAEEWEYRFRRPDGRVRLIAGSGVLLRDASGDPIRLVGINRDITALRRRELERGRLVDQLHVVLDEIREGVAVFDRAGNLLAINAAALALSELSSLEEFRQKLPEFKDLFELSELTGELIPPFQWPLSRALRGETFGNVEVWARRKDLERPARILTFSARTVSESAAGPEMRLLMVRDITQRRLAEEQSREGEARYRTIFETLADGIMILDERGMIASLNAAAEQLFGYRAAEAAGIHVGQLIPSLAGKSSGLWVGARREAEGIRKEGASFEVRLAVGETRIGGRRMFIISVEDITLRKRAQTRDQWRTQVLEALTTGASLNTVLDLISLGVEAQAPGAICSILLLDDDGGHLEYASAPSLPEHYNQALARFEIGEGVGSCGTAAATGQRVIVEDIQIHPYWSCYRELAESAGVRSAWSEPIRSSHGKILGTFCIYHREPRRPGEDQIELIQYAANLASLAIDRKRADEALVKAKAAAEAANRAKDEFLAVLSHELRTPLTPVLAIVSAPEVQEQLPGEARSELEVVRRNVELEVRLIDDLLDVTRISRGKIDLRPEVIDAHDCLRSVLEICGNEAEAKRIGIGLKLVAKDHHIRADATRLRQAFWNLIRNAIKFTPEGGRVSIRSTSADGRIRIEIRDTGIGIDPTQLPRIFNAFEQCGSTRQFGGLGLGLSIARTVVELHGGTIRAQSEGKGRGASFTVELATAPSQAGVPGKAPEPSQPARRCRILLVEDHPDTLRMLSRMLERWGYGVRAAATLGEALDWAGRESFDMLISDLGLPDGSGLELMRELKARYGLHGLALSGYGMESDVRESREAGFDEHIVKPVDTGTLRAALQRIAA